METFGATYGYAAVFLGIFVEGETILVLAGFLAHRGYLQLQWVLLVGFLGTLAADQLFYYLGRLKGAEVLERRPHWQRGAERVFGFLDRHQTLCILGFRFVYGMRTVTPVVIGASGVAPLRYLVLNVLGAALWAVAIGILGYGLGNTVERILTDVEQWELWVMAAIAAVGLLVWLLSRRSRRRP